MKQIVRDFTCPTPAGQVNEGQIVSVTETTEAQHSIETSRDAKGVYRHSVKYYFTEGGDVDAVNKIQQIFTALDAQFGTTKEA